MIKPESWKPIEIESLEPNAEVVARSNCNMLVTAGPGAGKTELLAQRACYLLQTNICKNPQKILAISFKRDAADNLKQRVKQRCGTEFSDRFISLTYDSFFKDILDRFKSALPDEYRLASYDITDIKRGETRGIIDSCGIPDVSFDELQSISHDTLENILLCGKAISKIGNESLEDKVAKQIWHNFLTEKKLTFMMISRLCELILEYNPVIINCLRLTYSHVFLDEFQDTTKIQYDILKKCFHNSQSVLTAVGDDKQQIMVWAGALVNAFDKFKQDFSAEQISLHYNYRSIPELVDIQKNIAQLITKSQYAATSISKSSQENACDIIIYPDEFAEAKSIAYIIQERITKYKLSPNDICILVRQRVSSYGESIITELNKKCIKARIEERYQKLLSEPLVKLVINYIKLWYATNAESWQMLFEFYENTMGPENVDDNFLAENVSKLSGEIFSLSSTNQLVDFIISLLGETELKRMYPQYANDSHWKSTILDLKTELSYYCNESADFKVAVDNLEGKNSIPIMSIHKSKGLEYDTVIFVGLEDSAFWNYPNKPREESCTFFVALSRAKRKIIFTITIHRQDNRGYNRKTSLDGINPIIEKLQECNHVEAFKYDAQSNSYLRWGEES